MADFVTSVDSLLRTRGLTVGAQISLRPGFVGNGTSPHACDEFWAAMLEVWAAESMKVPAIYGGCINPLEAVLVQLTDKTGEAVDSEVGGV